MNGEKRMKRSSLLPRLKASLEANDPRPIFGRDERSRPGGRTEAEVTRIKGAPRPLGMIGMMGAHTAPGPVEMAEERARGKAGVRHHVGRLAIGCIKVYRRIVSPLLPPLCRFYPSCSAYAQQAIGKRGLARGSGMALVRLAKCHPWHPGGFDPVE